MVTPKADIQPNTPAATAEVAQSRAAGGSIASNKGLTPLDDTDSESNATRNPGFPREHFTVSERITWAALASSYERMIDDPIYRPLRIYTVDPTLRRSEGAIAVINVPYEPLKPGPIGRRFSVNKSTDSPFQEYQPVNLDNSRALIGSGYDASVSNPNFHHQMVYAVCSSVYATFRSALGREVAWGFGSPILLVEPHGMRQENAMYAAEKSSGALKFGWFQYKSNEGEKGESQDSCGRGYAFSCLSHDVIAHELTHALLSGLRARFNVPSNPDVDAFHEALADIVALFQRFSYKDVVKSALRQSSGDIDANSLLQQFALEIAQASGRGKSLRSVYSDTENEDMNRVNKGDKQDRSGQSNLIYQPNNDADRYQHSRVLVSAIFEAFVIVYRRKSAPYIRLATGGTGLIQAGSELPTDLLDLLAHTASRAASHFLAICIRAIDYCPPVDIEFGEYLRALITADFNLVPDDPWGYREAIIESFAHRKIYPRDVIALTEDALLWKGPDKHIPKINKLSFSNLRFSGGPGSPAKTQEMHRRARALGAFVVRGDLIEQFGCVTNEKFADVGGRLDPPCIESVRSSRRVGPDGQTIYDLVAEVTQRLHVPIGGTGGLDFFGGATVILGPDGEIRYIIRKQINDKIRMARSRRYFLHGIGGVTG